MSPSLTQHPPETGVPFAARSMALALPVSILGVFAWLCFRDRQYLLVDDAYIAFRYAANFAHGHGLVWNPGERVEGYTNPLWVLFLSVFARFAVDLTAVALVLSIAFAIASLLLLAKIARETFPGRGHLAGSLAPLLLAGNQSFAHAATSGMESTCFGFLVLAAIYWLVRARERPTLRKWAALSLSLAYLVRPEAVLVAAVALLVELAALSGPFAARLRTVAPVGLAVAAMVFVHVVFRFLYYGYPLPNTFYAKVILGQLTVIRGSMSIAGFVLAGGWLALPGVRELERPSHARPYIVHGYCLFFVYCAYLLVIGGDAPFWYRFYVPLLPLPLLASSQLALRIGAALRSGLMNELPIKVYKAAAMSGAAALMLVGAAFGYVFGERFDVVGRIDATARARIENVSKFFRREARPGSLVAAGAVGHVGYYNRHLRILDVWGLNDVHIAHLDVAPNFMFGHDKSDYAYVLSLKPDYMYMLRAWEPNVVDGYDLCWPSRDFVSIYRRRFPLQPTEIRLGVPAPHNRILAPPRPCRPPPPAKAPVR